MTLKINSLLHILISLLASVWGMVSTLVWWWGSRVVWSRMVRLNIGFSFSFILDIGDETIFVIGVICHNLSTTIWQLNAIFATDNSIFILTLSLGKSFTIIIYTTIFIDKGFWWNLLLMIWFSRWMIWSRCWGMIWSRCWSIRCRCIRGVWISRGFP